MLRRRGLAALSATAVFTCSMRRPSLPAMLTCFHLFVTVRLDVTWPPLCCKLRRGFTTLSRQTLLSEGWQCCESWRDAELGDRAVCAVRDGLETRGESGSESPSDTTGEDLVLVRWVVLVFRHTVTLPWTDWRTIHWPHPVQVLIASTTDARHHRPFAARPTTPAVRFVAVIYYAVPRRVCCSAPAACRELRFGWHSRLYTML